MHILGINVETSLVGRWKRVDPRVGRLDDWVVAGDHQRQGVGSALARASRSDLPGPLG
ncbi:GNAT family N-acetyltransferase [Actinopolymorpha pittospori]|uniref:N-acetyltransferase domain-containing protein n=1 Tax=Actinopolymorpha pittospori TaxID=648752 RepID=A0A927MYX1_9ACTN|nr:GNAT family N-acetyltransferase [Actinopolymorpha pittospori]MBE1608879.1 hypothetical protein [Actinopolymorpha pittospori]